MIPACKGCLRQRLVDAYVRRKVRASFRGVWLRGELPAAQGGLLVYVNHGNWWDGFVLHPNQTLEIFVVPADEDDQPMLGLLALSASASGFLSLDSPLIGVNSSANALIISPSDLLGETAEVVITDEESGLKTTATFQTSDEPQPVSCN